MESLRRWVEESPYSAALGTQLEKAEEGVVEILLPYQEGNSNPGGALHGGCAATLAAMGAQCVTRLAMGEDAGPFHTAGIQVNYLSAALSEDVVARAELLRRGKDMSFVQTRIETRDGKPIAEASAMARARHAAEPAVFGVSAGDEGGSDPGPMGPHVSKTPYMGARGMRIEHMAEGRSRVTLPASPANADLEHGVHEGAVLALLDTAGAMASWAETGPGAFKASTPTLQAQILGPTPKQDLVAYARVVERDGALFWADAEVVGAEDQRRVARGTVLYRIVT
ncbi:MAG: PaaI family thioesterase [Myxococcota bacterium]|nr:PaaI family thioesterase [Myxococcota bacterium]